ncbi:beta-hexosaminidase subunit beta-like [Adelges cooleyi]|uniref:beta-hexosaminidase subunit beta-like n=1 Tax=Adelges cooleyi TaxID=133065 RepID=UPI00217FE519|nr:beta-hexosaminidase subunit beta-like [Adelges cooleyi]
MNFNWINCVLFLLIISPIITITSGQYINPQLQMTHGEVWPKPFKQKNTNVYHKMDPETFKFKIVGQICDDLQEALKRYDNILFLRTTNNSKTGDFVHMFPNSTLKGQFNTLKVQLMSRCDNEVQHPSLYMNERYFIKIKEGTGILSAYSIWGIYRGLETFSQLITLTNNGTLFIIRDTTIKDHPKYKHRGYMLDTSRHFLSLQMIFDSLDAMVYSKLNVFHWHIVDDPSFPYQSSSFPSLSEKGAYDQSSIYTKADVECVIEYARLRGIRVIPEFDTPDHTGSWGPGGIPGLLTQCSESDPTSFGPIDPTLEQNYDFIKTLFTEIKELFKDQYFHLGGDEVRHGCWDNNKRIQEFMKNNSIHDILELENYFFQKIFKITNTLKAKTIVWDELFDDKIKLDRNTVVQVWQGDYINKTLNVLKSGHYALLSSCWYLNYVKYGKDWLDVYRCNPGNFSIEPKYNHLFLGGEACMWTEYVDDSNVLPLSWPGASVVGEVLWSHQTNETEAAPRLEEHICRLKRRGIPAKPSNGPSHCYY